jgi:hypothetical protein
MMQFFLISLLLASRRRQIRDLAELAVGGEKGSIGEALFPRLRKPCIFLPANMRGKGNAFRMATSLG